MCVSQKISVGQKSTRLQAEARRLPQTMSTIEINIKLRVELDHTHAAVTTDKQLTHNAAAFKFGARTQLYQLVHIILPCQCAHQFLLVNPFSLPKAAFADKSTAYATSLHATSLHVSKLANLIEDDERRTTNDTLKTNQPTKRPTTNDQRPTNCLLFVRQFHPQLTPTPAPTPTHNPHTHSLTHSPQRTVHCSLYPGTVSTEYYHVVLVLAV